MAFLIRVIAPTSSSVRYEAACVAVVRPIRLKPEFVAEQWEMSGGICLAARWLRDETATLFSCARLAFEKAEQSSGGQLVV